MTVKKLFFLFAAIFFIIYFVRCLLYFDPDIGWHLRMGQIIFHHGIPKTDPFSYSMPGYPFVDHEWLTNVLLYLLYSIAGFPGLAILFSGLTLLAAYLPVAFLKPKWSLFPFLLAATTLVGFMGIRTQVLSWIFFAVLLQVLLNKQYFEKFKWFLPILILLWTNMHGSFPIGIVVIGLYCLTDWVQSDYKGKRSFAATNLLLFLACLGVTFINPYGWRIWWEVWMQLSDTGLKSHIMEWFPAFNFTGAFSLWLLLALSVILTWQYRNKFSLFEKLLYLILLLFGISSMRQMPFWFVIALPMTAMDMKYLYEEASQHPITKKNFAIAYKVFFIIVIAIISAELVYDYLQTKGLSESAFYPVKAVVYLQTHPSNGNIFSHYDFGGYLIWKLPNKKVFVDGRMPSWRWQAPENESKDAFLEWEDIGSGRIKFAKAAKKYDIDTVLWFAPNAKGKPLLLESIVNGIANLLHLKIPNDKDFISELPKDGFKMVYKDDKSAVYRK